MATTYELIASVTLGSDASNIEFTSIPSAFTDLVILASLRGTESGATRSLRLRFNSDTGSNYQYRWLVGTGSAASSGSNTNNFCYMGAVPGSTSTADSFGSLECVIPNYSGSSNKSFSVTTIHETNATAADMRVLANLWSSTSAISDIEIYPDSLNFKAGSSAYLYGITKA